MGTLAAIIARDVAMCAKVLQLVNSGFFGTPQRVTNAVHAARLLGLDTINSLVDSAVFPAARRGTAQKRFSSR